MAGAVSEKLVCKCFVINLKLLSQFFLRTLWFGFNCEDRALALFWKMLLDFEYPYK